jgi:hypothetical protein
MTMQQFINDNKVQIDAHITKRVPNLGRVDNKKRRMWIANDEYLYGWARSQGVRV